MALVAALVLLPLGAAGLYLMLGSPDLPGQGPLAARREAPGQQSIPELVARIEAHLEQNPEDGRGWEVVGPVYMRLGPRFDDAVTRAAQKRAAISWIETLTREADLGEALTAAANGVVTAEAKEAFDRALKLDADDFRGRYFAGLAAEQDGRPKDAAEIWRKLLASAPPGSGWAGFVREVAGACRPGRCGRQRRGPSGADVAAASEMSPEQREDHDPRHGGATGGAAATGRFRRRGLVASAARLYGAGRQGAGARPLRTTRRALSERPATSSAGSTS